MKVYRIHADVTPPTVPPINPVEIFECAYSGEKDGMEVVREGQKTMDIIIRRLKAEQRRV